jgi:hypothetical protein
MARTLLDVWDNLGEASVSCTALAAWGASIDGQGEQRMREGDPTSIDRDDPGLFRGSERIVGRVLRCPDEVERGTEAAEQASSAERVASGRRRMRSRSSASRSSGMGRGSPEASSGERIRSARAISSANNGLPPDAS